MKRQELLRQLDRDVESLKGALEDVTRRIAKFKEEAAESKSTWDKLRDMVNHETIWGFIDSGKIHYQAGNIEDGQYIVVVGTAKEDASYFLFVSESVLKVLNSNNGIAWCNQKTIK
jgi:hypothetical protein